MVTSLPRLHRFASTLRLALSARAGSLRLGALVGVALAAFGAALAVSPVAPFLERELGLGWLFLARGPIAAPEDLLVIGIDRTTGARLGMPGPEPRDWPRSVHAQLTDKLTAAGAKLIVFDLLFEQDKPAGDEPFARSMAAAGNVILARDIERTQLGGGIVQERMAPIVTSLEAAALASGVIPLSDVEPRKDSYWSFLASLSGAPSLPVVVQQAYSLDAYDELYSLLAALRPREVADYWPKRASEARSTKSVAAVPQLLRELLLKDPALHSALRAALNDGKHTQLDEYKRRLLLGLVDAAAGSERRYFNFYGPRWSIPRIGYDQALADNGKADESSRFKNKVVFVGFSAVDSADNNFIRDCHPIVYTDPDGVPVCGVELAATAFANLRQGSALDPPANRLVLSIVVIAGLALGLAALATNAAISTAMVLSLAIAYWGYAYHEFAFASRWLPVVLPAAVLPALALFGSALARYTRAERQRKRLYEALKRFVPDGVADAIVDTVPDVTSYRQLVFGACLATDAQEYSTVAEQLPATELALLVQDYSKVLFTTVQQNGGVVCGEAGDSMIGIWTGSSSRADLRAQACEAALEILARVEDFNRTSGRPALPTRFGLHAGEFVLGVIGNEQHLDFRAVGDIVNTASRIETLNKELGTRLLVSSAAVEALQELFLFRPLGSFNVKGRVQPVAVCELLGRRAEAPPDNVLRSDLFALALARFEDGRWAEAEEALRVVLREFPDDGPSRYYLTRCEAMRAE